MTRVLVAMSGGVDSAVTALLLKEQGYECIGATMKLHNYKSNRPDNATCGGADDIEDARAVAEKLGMEYHVFDYSSKFDDAVIQYFVETYERGWTPNPCIRCNEFLKFGMLYEKARELGCDYIATGHYARIEKRGGRYILKKGVDPMRDQSYVLYSLTQDKLAHTLFPLGEYSKDEVRKLAADAGFSNASKPDSQDICFIPDKDYMSFIEKYDDREYEPGDIVDQNGNKVGEHKGAIGYTTGQRRGLGVALGYPAYVLDKSMVDNTVTVGPDEALYHSGLLADRWNWVAVGGIGKPMEVDVRTRHHQVEAEGTLYAEGDKIKISFYEPQRAITRGQTVVCYRGDEVVGGGQIIDILD